MKKTAIHIALLVVMLFCLGGRVFSQDSPWLKNRNYLFEIRGHYGCFYHHHFEMERFNAHFPSFEASFYQSTFGEKEWHTAYNYPFIGVTYYHSKLGGFQELGKVYAIYPFINYPLLRGDNAMLSFKVGVGLAYLTNKFDHIENHYNFSIGSHLNAAVNLSFEYRQVLFPRMSSIAAFGLTHFSNGATKAPNYGLNAFSGSLGLAFYLRDPRASFTPSRRPDYYTFEFDGKNWYCIDLDYGIGIKDVSQTMGKNERYFVHDLTTRFLVQFTEKSRAGLSLSLVKDNSDKALPDFVSEDGQMSYINRYYVEDVLHVDTVAIHDYQMLKPNVGIVYSMTMDRMSFLFELGFHLNLRQRDEYGRWNYKTIADTDHPGDSIHVLKPFAMATDMSKGSAYQKLTIRYNVVDNVFASISLTSHLARADYVCFGIGYRFDHHYYLKKHAKKSTLPPGVL
ncbi:MAG: acyloxyacyl hydrolase [Bacteroidales bacterium]|nr:acyloxyacyl hydrolase [Bacteroidales bacterium]